MRLQALVVIFYLLGMSYGAVVIAMQPLGYSLSKTLVSNIVQAMGKKVGGMRRHRLIEAVRVAAMGSDGTSVQGKWYPLGIAGDAVKGVVIRIEGLKGEDADHLAEWLELLAKAVKAEALVSEDADAFKEVTVRVSPLAQPGGGVGAGGSSGCRHGCPGRGGSRAEAGTEGVGRVDPCGG